MALITITTTHFTPPLLTATHHTTTTSVPGTPEQAAATYHAAHPEYVAETPTRLRHWHHHASGEWESTAVRFTTDTPTLF